MANITPTRTDLRLALQSVLDDIHEDLQRAREFADDASPAASDRITEALIAVNQARDLTGS